jgi:fibronectin-binding autotransporter adhesin
MFKLTRSKRAGSIRLAAAAVVALLAPAAHAAEQFWRTDGTTETWTNPNWGSSAAGPFTTAYAANNDAHFTADSTVTFATVSIGNVTVNAGKTITVTAAGTLSMNDAVRTFDIGSGATLTWTSQTVTATSAAGINKTGDGILDLGALTWNTTMNGGFTVGAGTLIVSGSKALGNGSLSLNGGTLQSSGTRTFTPISLSFGGDFSLGGSGNANWDAATTIALGGSTRTITNSTTSGTRQFRGLISGSSGSGLTFSGSGAGQIYIGNAGNTFDGPISINGGDVVFNGNGTLGSSTSITLDGGRLTMASMDPGAILSALTSATIASGRNVFVGDGAGTSISIEGLTGVTTYDGVIANKPSETGAWAKQGAGKLVLRGVSTYTGATAINQGILQLALGNDRLPTGTTVSLGQSASANIGTLDLNGRNQQIAGLNSVSGTNASVFNNNTITSGTAATLTLGGAGTYAYGDNTNANSGIITGTISIVKTGSGTQTFGDVNTYTGTTTVSAGTLVVASNAPEGANGALGNAGSAVVLGDGSTAAGGAPSLLISNTSTVTRAITVGSISNPAAYNATIGGSNTTGASTFDGSITLDTAAANYTTTLQAAAGGTVEFKAGPWVTNDRAIAIGSAGNTGTVKLSDTLATTGGVSVNFGALLLGSSNRLGDTTPVSIAGGVLDMGSGLADTVGGVKLTGGSIIGSGSTLTSTSDFDVQSGSASAKLGGSVGLMKSTAGTVTLSGANTYSNITTVSAGSLVVAANAPSGANGALGNATSAVVLGDGSTTASGAPSLLISNTSTVSRPITIGSVSNPNAYNATLGGSNTSGTSTFDGNITLNTTASTYTTTLQAATGGTVEFKTGTWTTNNKAIAIGSSGNIGIVKLSNTLATTNGISVNFGTLLLGSSNRLGDTTPVSIAGGILDTGTGLTDTVSALSISSGSLNGTGTITAGTYTLSGGTINASLGAGAATAPGGTTILNGTLAGNLSVNGGTVNLGASNRISASSAVSVASGTFGLNGFDNTVSGAQITGGSITGGGTLISTSAFDMQSGSASAKLGGSVGLTKTTAGTVTLSGANAYTGGSTVAEGILNIRNGTALGTTGTGTSVSNGATLQLQGGITVGAEALTLNGGAAGGQPGALVNVGDTNTYGGQITVASSSTISAAGSSVLNLSGGLVKNGTTATLTGGGTININTVGISGPGANSDLIVDGVTVNEDVANSYNGPTSILNGGIVNANVANALPTANGRTAVTMDGSGSGSSQLVLAANQSVASLIGAGSSTINLGANTLTVGATTGTTIFAGSISATAGALTKDNPSTQTLSGSNAYTGQTTVTGGTLKLAPASGTNNIVFSTKIVVGPGATLDVVDVGGSGANNFAIASGQTLTGTGTVAGSTTIASGSAISPADANTVGTLTTDAVTWVGGGKYVVDVNVGGLGGPTADGNHDLLAINNVTGTDLTLPSSGTFTFKVIVAGGALDQSGTQWITIASGASGATAGPLDKSRFTFVDASDQPENYDIQIIPSGGGFAFQVAANPEPTTTLSFGAGLSALTLGRWRGRWRRRVGTSVLGLLAAGVRRRLAGR